MTSACDGHSTQSAARIWQLRGATTTYAVRLFENRALMLDYCGSSGSAIHWPEPPSRHLFATTADLAPLECLLSVLGTLAGGRDNLILKSQVLVSRSRQGSR